MIRTLAIFLAFFALISRAPVYTVEHKSINSKKEVTPEVAIQSTIVPECNFEPNTSSVPSEANATSDFAPSHSIIPDEVCPSCESCANPCDPCYAPDYNSVPMDSSEVIYESAEVPYETISYDNAAPCKIHDENCALPPDACTLPFEVMQNEMMSGEVYVEDPMGNDGVCYDPTCYPPDQKFAPNGCPVPPGGCQPFNKCDPNINPYAPPPEGACCPPAPIRGAHWGLNAATMILPIMLVVGVAAIILVEHSDNSH